MQRSYFQRNRLLTSFFLSFQIDGGKIYKNLYFNKKSLMLDSLNFGGVMGNCTIFFNNPGQRMVPEFLGTRVKVLPNLFRYFS